MEKRRVALICIHNSCRGQVAEALGRHSASDVFESYSARSGTKPQINRDAAYLMKELYGIDMEQSQYSRTFDNTPEPDIAISMGYDMDCPYISRTFNDDWGLNDLTGCPDEAFREVIGQIEGYIIWLRVRTEGGVYGWKKKLIRGSILFNGV